MIYRELNNTYTQWKATRTSLSGNTYVITTPARYIGALVQKAEQIVHTVAISRLGIIDTTDLDDFETNILPTAIAKISVDDAISAEID